MSTHSNSHSLDPEDRLHLLLGRLVHAFGRFDFNMGLQLKWLGPYRGVEVDHLLVGSKPFTMRFAQLEPLVMDVFGHQNDRSGPACLNSFTPRDKETACGLKRCRVVHGGGGRCATNRPTRWATRGAPGFSF